MKLEFCTDIFSKSTKMPNSVEIRPVGTELFHADGLTDMTKLIVAFTIFLKNEFYDKDKGV